MIKRIAALLLAVLLIFSLAACGGGQPQADQPSSNSEQEPLSEPEQEYISYYFKSAKLLNQHYEKHGIDMGFDSAEEYEAAASDVINNPNALTKTEAEDGDFVFYIEDTNEFVILSTDGYIRTYFLPDRGKAYYDKQ